MSGSSIDDESYTAKLLNAAEGEGETIGADLEGQKHLLSEDASQRDGRRDKAGVSAGGLQEMAEGIWASLKASPQTIPFLASVLWFSWWAWINTVVQIIVQRDAQGWWKDIPPEKLIPPDLGFSYAPFYPHPKVVDSLMLPFGFVTLLYMLYHSGWAFPERVRRYVFTHGSLFALRAFSIVGTALPNPDLLCKPTVNTERNPFLESLNVIFGGEVTCADVFFSGHTVTLALWGALWYTYAPHWWLRIAVWAYILVAYAFILATRFHYTIDIFAGFLLAMLIWRGYHLYMIVAFLRHRQNWRTRFVRWFEDGALDIQGCAEDGKWDGAFYEIVLPSDHTLYDDEKSGTSKYKHKS